MHSEGQKTELEDTDYAVNKYRIKMTCNKSHGSETPWPSQLADSDPEPSCCQATVPAAFKFADIH